MKRWSMTMALAAAGLFLLSGCPDLMKRDPVKLRAELAERVQAYNECFRWREFEKAAQYVVPEKRGDFLTAMETLRTGFSLDGFQVREIVVGPSGEEAVVKVRRTFVRAPSVDLQSVELTQKWVLRDGVWFLESGPY